MECGSHLWAFNSKWPDLIHPVASALDTTLPVPSVNVHLMVASKRNWVAVEGGPEDSRFDEYPEKSIADFHAEHGWTVE